MSLDKKFRRIVFIQVLLGVVAFCIAEQNAALLLMVGAVTGLSWYVTEGPRAWFLPQWAINTMALALTGWVAYEAIGLRIGLLLAMGHFLLGLQVLLLYGRKDNLEYAQLMVLSLMQMITAGAMGTSMIFGLLLLAYSALALVSVLMLHLKTTSDTVQEANRAAAPPQQPAPPPKAVAGPGFRQHFRWLAVVVAAICVVVAVTVFVVAPRPSAGRGVKHLKGFGGGGPGHLSPEVDLGRGLGTSGHQTVATLRIKEHQPAGAAGQQPWLLRGHVLYEYQPKTRRWTRPRYVGGGLLALSDAEAGVRLASVAEDTPLRRAQVTLSQRADIRSPLFTVEAVAGPHAGPVHVQTDQPMNLRFHPRQARLLTEKGYQQMASYTLRWPASAVADLTERYYRHLKPQPAGSRRAAGEAVERADQWPVQPDRVARLARRAIAGEGVSTGARASDEQTERLGRALADYLRSNYRYTLSHQSPPPGEDPVIAFLFNSRRGHCELFASGMVALARSIGIPARMITGYRVSEYNEWGQYYVARSRNAHAWTELYCGPNKGWVRMDPTPPQRVAQENAPRGGWLTWLRHGYEYAEGGWMQTVVAYNEHDRRRVMDRARAGARSLTQNNEDDATWFGQGVSFIRSLPQRWRLDRLHYTIIGALLLGIVIGLGVLVRIYVRRRQKLADLQLAALPRARRLDLARKLGFYLTMLEMLERHGYQRPEWQSPFSFAQELAAREPQKLDPVVALTELFYEIRFGYRELNEDRQHRIRRHLRQLEQSLSRRTGASQRQTVGG